MKNEVWVLGATGRTGRAVATQLHERGVPLVLVGRNHERLEALAAKLGGAPRLAVGTLGSILAELAQVVPAVVVNTIGPFTTTAVDVIRACAPGTHYVDVSNELQSIQQVLELDQKAAAANQILVTGAGFGVLATESVVLRLCEGQPTPARVRVDALSSVATEPGVVGSALAATIIGILAFGGWQVRQGCMKRGPLMTDPAQLTTPDGDFVGTVSGPSGELLAAWRASKADHVVAASSIAQPNPIVRRLLPAISAIVRVPVVSRFVTNRIARVSMQAQDRPRRHSWAHARAEWSSGTLREGWLRVGDGMDFTVGVIVEVTHRLHKGEGRPGAYTPGALFGPALAEAAGGTFMIDLGRGSSDRG